jgi:hypothetical protein
MKLSSQFNRFQVGTSRCDGPDREAAGGLLAPLNAARTAQRAVPTTEAQRGVALVITLILLAVITTLAIAFLALTHRETGAVDAMSRTTDAELATESALERAKAQIIAGYPVHNFNLINNPPISPDILGPEMFVSVCWETNRLVPTNHIDGSVPVFVDTNRAGANGPPEDRFFVDLNRNGFFEETGLIPVTDNAGRFIPDNNPGPFLTNFLRGDPQWIGVLQDPRLPHAPTNRYIARYALMVLPAGRSLDVNWIHNDTRDVNLGPGKTGYFRNQGVGGFEANLAAFLADLNNNYWNGYDFDPLRLASPPPDGVAFQDAKDLLLFRYLGVKANPGAPFSRMAYLDDLLGPAPPLAIQQTIQQDYIDSYADGPIGVLGALPSADDDLAPSLPSKKIWPGTANRTNYFTVHDLLDPSKSSIIGGFQNRLGAASRNGNSYDRYTFYRMLSQMGTDSVAENDEEEGKININYVNLGGIKATELISWTNAVKAPLPGVEQRTGRLGPELFFLSVVTNLLAREYPKLPLTTNLVDQPLRIPVFTNGSRFWWSNSFNLGPLYSARIHQILQQAANIYDAVRELGGGETYPFYPSVFRPRFRSDSGNLYIVDYRLSTERPTDPEFPTNPNHGWVDLDLGQRPVEPDVGKSSVYNIPLIVGARKGYPNFNEFVSRTFAYATRRLDVAKPANEIDLNNARITNTFSLFITNQYGFEAWNSYLSSYRRPLALYYSNDVTVGIKSTIGNVTTIRPIVSIGTNFIAPYAAFAWRSNTYVAPPTIERLVLGWTNILTDDAGGVTNQWDVYVTNRVRFFLVDGERIVDAVALSFTNALLGLGSALSDDDTTAPGTALPYLWSNRRSGRWSLGIQQQLNISQNAGLTVNDTWKDYGQWVSSKDDGIRKFNDFIQFRTNVLTSARVPFTPSRHIVQTNTWQVSDPLVHYTLDDLQSGTGQFILKKTAQIPNSNLGQENPIYVPWGGKDPGEPDPNLMDASLRDSGVQRSDYWDFPANKFPNLGWLGRVHRGTPWQTVYLKSLAGKAANPALWHAHSGLARSLNNAMTIHPTNDWRLLDIFTAAIHPNATRGRLSVNQTNPAAWSAVLSGVTVSAVVSGETNGVGMLSPVDLTVQPGLITNFVPRIVEGINKRRDQLPNRQFTKLSEFMSVPELTFTSPLLAANGFDALAPAGIVNVFDTDYERIPQQILSLLKVGEPRFVIYAWGQSLKPARNGVVNNGGTLSLAGPSIDPGDKVCNNYQVTGETATRAVVRVVFPEKLRLPDVPLNHPLYGTPDYRKPHVVVESFNVIPLE